MNTSILNTNIQEFINANLNSDISKLLLKGTAYKDVETKAIIEQIEAKKRCKIKLPTWYNTKDIYYPNKLHIEQTSSEITAKFKSELIKGDTIIDLTGGFGVDCFYFSKRFKTVKHCEINEILSGIVKHNYNQLAVTNIKAISNNGLDYLSKSQKTYDWIYIDPSRRDDRKGKVFFLNDCLPNVPKHLNLLFKHSKNILIKTSPLLDISAGASELKYVKTVYVIAVNNEMKELLWVLEDNFKDNMTIEAVNIAKEGIARFTTSSYKETTALSPYQLPLTYLYEPNAAILKAGAFHSVSQQLNVYKLHKHTHLYTKDELINFPGRRFKIESIIPYNKKELRKSGILKANITTRHFPETVASIRKKFKIKDGGVLYLFFTTLLDESKAVIICKQI